MSDDWIEQLSRDYQNAITRGLYEGIAQLPQMQQDRVMACQAHACVEEFVKLYDLSPSLDLETFLARMKGGGPSKIEIRREGSHILWQERHQGVCMCPLVRRDVVPLQPALCACAVHWLRMLVERFAQRPCHVELLESVAGGAESCVFSVTLGEAR